jgi:hypothetical protein
MQRHGDNLRDQRRLVVEVMVHERRIDVGAPGDRAKRCSLVPALAELRRRGLEDSCPGVAASGTTRPATTPPRRGHRLRLLHRLSLRPELAGASL